MASQVEDIKWIPGTDFLVDGFNFKSPRCSHYFLTHFHSDHTVGLNRGFKGGVIYCSHVTARLLVHDMGLRPQLVRPLDVGRPVVISGVRVTPLDANHCPGSLMFLFEVPTGPHAAAPALAAGAGAATGAKQAEAAGSAAAGVGREAAGGDTGCCAPGTPPRVAMHGGCSVPGGGGEQHGASE
ncbi:hypothetical protein Agub_g4704, partial [Astrephomene gubernaculifera]